MQWYRFTLSAVVLASAGQMLPQASSQTVREKKITRVFWQDRESQKVSYADVTASNRWGLKRGWVNGFPTLDSQKQQLADMQQASGVVLMAVRGNQGESPQGGWVAIDSGVFEEPHGNHFHWRYTGIPSVKKTTLNEEDRNPDHVSVYNNMFYIAKHGDKGFTKANPGNLKGANATSSTTNFPGGGGRSRLAAVNNALCYATWDDTGGDNAGRVDVVNLQKASEQLTYSFRLPTGSIRSATANSGKVFFATDGGIYWTTADTTLSKSTETTQVASVSAASGSGQPPIQTNGLINAGTAVIYTTNGGGGSALSIISAAYSTPQLINLPITIADGLQLTTPKTVLSLGKRFVFVFQERIDATSDVKEQLTVIELDPNRDNSFSDAGVRTTIPVGASKVVGDFGHHDIAFDAYGRYAIFTDPGDGVLTLMSLNDLRVRARFKVGGIPDNIIAIGAPEHFH